MTTHVISKWIPNLTAATIIKKEQQQQQQRPKEVSPVSTTLSHTTNVYLEQMCQYLDTFYNHDSPTS